MDYTYFTIDTVAANQNTLHGSHRVLLLFNIIVVKQTLMYIASHEDISSILAF